MAGGSGSDHHRRPRPAAGTTVARDRCLVRLHGKGEEGAPTTVANGVTVVAPTGNADGWGGRQWLYFPDQEYDAARAVVSEAAAGCQQVIVDGFSNGASFAAKLYCRGETLGGRLVRVIVDDPVVDAGVEGCRPDPSVAVTLYWTGALAAQSAAGGECAQNDWTCEGGTTIGIDAYQQALGTTRHASPNTDHKPFLDAPEASMWR